MPRRQRLGVAVPASRSEFAGFAGVRNGCCNVSTRNCELCARCKNGIEGYQEVNGRRECRGEACDDAVVIARAAAGLSQTDGNLASVSSTLLGKHMPHESSPLNAYTACVELRDSESFYRSGVPCKVITNRSLFCSEGFFSALSIVVASLAQSL